MFCMHATCIELPSFPHNLSNVFGNRAHASVPYCSQAPWLTAVVLLVPMQDGDTPLYTAYNNGHLAVVEELLSRSASIDMTKEVHHFAAASSQSVMRMHLCSVDIGGSSSILLFIYKLSVEAVPNLQPCLLCSNIWYFRNSLGTPD